MDNENMMKLKCYLLFALAIACSALSASAQLAVTYNGCVPATISYNGVSLENTTTYTADAFHIWHMQTTDLNGNVLSSGDDGWGEDRSAVACSNSTQTYTFSWGSIATQFAQSGNNLNMTVTVTDNPSSGVIFQGAVIDPFALHFPSMPNGFYGYSQFASSTESMPILAANYGTGIATVASLTSSPPVIVGWDFNSGNTYTPLLTTTPPSDYPTYKTQQNANLQPGSSFTYTVSLRFTNEGTQASLSDVASAYQLSYPRELNWANHEPIGDIAIASNGTNSTSSNTNNASGCGATSANPRNYKTVGGVVNCTTSLVGNAAFEQFVLNTALQAVNTIAPTEHMQGFYVQDLEGEEYTQPTSYVGSPDQIASLSPEMEQAISGMTGALAVYNGLKLDDAFFQILASTGLKVGMLLRPNTFTASGSTATQVFPTSVANAVSILTPKVQYAVTRWNASLFYVDSDVYSDGGQINPDLWQQMNAAFPNALFMPEVAFGQLNSREFLYSAPFYNFQTHTDLGTPFDLSYTPSTVFTQPFGVNLVNDVSSSTLSSNATALTTAVTGGDVLIDHADYADANESEINAIETNAAYTAPLPTVTSNTWYVRTDGGNRYTTHTGVGQCDGLHDAAYPGTGVDQPCAFNDIRWLWSDGEYASSTSFPSWGWVVQGGDTVILRGSIGTGASYRVGWNNPSNAQDSTSQLWYGFNNDAFDSHPPPVPSGTASQPTRILGENYASCSAQTARTQIHGGYGITNIFNMQGSSYVDMECLDLTDFSPCSGVGSASIPCNKNPGTLSDNADNGILWNNLSTNDTVNNVLIHGLSGSAMTGPTGGAVVMTNIGLIGNGGAGWNADNSDGTTGLGSLLVQNFNISWNGCAEEYPIVDALPYAQCADDFSQGYGDGFGTATVQALPTASQGTAYSYQIPNQGTLPDTYSLNSGSLPSGLLMSSSGLISGTPSGSTGIFLFSINISDKNGVGYGGSYQLPFGSYPNGWQVHFDQGLATYNTQDGLDALHLTGAASSMTITRVNAYSNMGQQIKNGGAKGITQNDVIGENCNALRFPIPGTPPNNVTFTANFQTVTTTGSPVNGNTTIPVTSIPAGTAVGWNVYDLSSSEPPMAITALGTNSITVSTAPYNSGSGDTLVFSNPVISNVQVTQGALAVAQVVSTPYQVGAVGAGTTITAINGSTVTLSQGPSASATGAQVNSAYNSALSDFCRASDAGVLITVGKGSTTVFDNNTIYSATDTAVELGCDNSNGTCDSTSLIDFRNNITVDFLNNAADGYVGGSTGDYPNPIYDGAGVGEFTNPGSLYSNNVTFRYKSNYTYPQPGETNALSSDPQLTDEVWHNWGANNATPLAGSPVIDTGTSITGLTVDYNGVTRPPFSRGAIELSVTVMQALQGLRGIIVRGATGLR